jgi:micrococcal nuclease
MPPTRWYSAAFLCLLASFAFSPLTDPADAQTLYRCTRVIDGDTTELETIGKVRLIGVDTPETVHPQKPVERFGKEASAFTRALLEGKRVWLEYDQQRRDRYERTLAYVFLEDSTFVNAAIITLGYGFAYAKYPFRYLEEFRGLEREARAAERGLWAPDTGEAPGIITPSTDTGEDVTVYVTRTGAKYHRAGCRYLARSMIPIALSEAALSYGRCSVCQPPTLSSPPAGSPSRSYQRSQPSSSGRCQAITKKGTQCKRNARPGSTYCWQHGG